MVVVGLVGAARHRPVCADDDVDEVSFSEKRSVDLHRSDRAVRRRTPRAVFHPVDLLGLFSARQDFHAGLRVVRRIDGRAAQDGAALDRDAGPLVDARRVCGGAAGGDDQAGHFSQRRGARRGLFLRRLGADEHDGVAADESRGAAGG